VKGASLDWPQGVVFDMNGLLLDSERQARDCFVGACPAHGWELDITAYHRCIGTTSETMDRILREHHADEFPLQEIELVWGQL